MPDSTTTTLRRAALLDFLWDEDALRYRSATNGRFVSEHSVKQAINTVIARSQAEIRSLATQAATGGMNLADFQSRIESELKNLHLASAVAAKGGWSQMKQADFGRIGAGLRFQYARLEMFVRHIEAGDVSQKQIEARAEMYVQSANEIYEGTRRAGAVEIGLTEERNILGEGEHCGECLDATAAGWVSIGSLPKIGQRTCLGNCLCSFEFR